MLYLLYQPTEFHKRLGRLVGSWEGVETHYPFPGFPEITHADARVNIRFELNGLLLVCDYATYRDGELLYLGHGLYGWEESSGMYTLYWFDTAGTDPVVHALGVWKDDTLTFEYDRGRQPMRVVYRFLGDEGYDRVIEASTPEGWIPVLGGEYHRIVATESRLPAISGGG
jgi:Protein of unknown function (DUF1579)